MKRIAMILALAALTCRGQVAMSKFDDLTGDTLVCVTNWVPYVARLASTQQLSAAVSPLVSTQQLAQAIAPLATTQQLAQAVAAAVAPLASTQQVAQAIAALPRIEARLTNGVYSLFIVTE